MRSLPTRAAGGRCPPCTSVLLQRPAERLVIRNARLFDPRDLVVSPGTSVLIRADRIVRVASDAQVKASADAEVLDAHGRFLMPGLEPLAQNIVIKRLFKDQKSLFQEQAQAQVGITPIYRLVSHEGPSHNREFTVEVLLGDQVAGRGQGRNKQAAEQEAARAALLSRGWI